MIKKGYKDRHRDTGTHSQGHKDRETQRHGDTKTKGNKNTGVQRHSALKTLRRRRKNRTEREKKKQD